MNAHIIETGAEDTPRMGAEFERLLRLRRQGEVNDEDMIVGLVEHGKTLERELAEAEHTLSIIYEQASETLKTASRDILDWVDDVETIGLLASNEE